MDSLHSLKVLDPCRRDWEQMPGDDTRRFCNQCHKHVHNLSALSTAAARDLVENRPDEFCVRFQQDAAGRVMTIDYAPAPTRRRWTTMFIAFFSLAASTVGGTVGYVFHRKAPVPTPPPPAANFIVGSLPPPTYTPSQSPKPCKPRSYNPQIDNLLTQGKIKG